jgi:hypothetical protein
MTIKQELIQQIQSIIASSKERAIRSVDTERVLMYWSRKRREQGNFRRRAGG